MNEIPSQAATPQPSPVPGRYVVLDYVISDLMARAKMGRQKYGTLLKSHNGRDALWDAYQESLDQTMYLRQALLERDGVQNGIPVPEMRYPMKRSTLFYLAGELVICAIPYLVLAGTLAPDDRLALMGLLALAMFGPLTLGLITLGVFKR